MDKHSYLSNADISSLETLYQQYKTNPDSVEFGWKKFFEGFEFSNFSASSEIPENVQKEFRVINLINAYRKVGHLFTKTNPVRERRKYEPTLAIENFGLDKSDLNTVFQAGSEIGIGAATLQTIVEHLYHTYCRSVGAEYMYMRKPEVLGWIQKRLESTKNTPAFSIEEKKQILSKLNEAVVFENFLQKKFTGQKRFSLEGAEALIPALDAIVERGAKLGIAEFVIGMAHRGRLNVLANILNKTYDKIFSEFEGKDYEDDYFEGDVKYHQGFTSIEKTESGKDVKLNLCPNPSHLEAVGPVVEGIARAKIEKDYHNDANALCPIIIHGDAAVAAQGVVYETIQMAQLDGYKTGGTIHLVINNQVGFTTNFADARSSIYCTDVAKVTLSPVFHVNGDDVEAVVNTIQLAIEFRQTFKRDIFIDLLCYRKYGHNEGDEPRFTQPLLYKIIETHPNPLEIYNKKLTEQGVVEAGLVKEMEKKFNQFLQERLEHAKQQMKAEIIPFLADIWKDFRRSTPEDFDTSPATGVDKKMLLDIAEKITAIPEGKKFFKKMEKIMQDRHDMVFKTDKLDWGMAELLAYATLLKEGHPVRFSGQDVERGTFSHRHAVLKVEDSEEKYVPLNHINDKQADFQIYNSLLSEYAVMGFDYGYAFATPNDLTIWEAQFGDFNNGAQIIIDQFLCCAEEKWDVMNGLVLFLPHGYEGMGAEHSSGRMERFLALSADYNMQVVNCTTPANFFHVLRRQMKREFRKPLIAFTPKSLLRHPACVSSLDDLANGSFTEVFDDATATVKDVKKVVFCSGKIYYELLEQKEKSGDNETALIRVEQLFPLPKKQLDNVVQKYKNAEKWYWIQEEPANMGAWPYIVRLYRNIDLEVIARPDSGTPATGSHERHAHTQKKLVEKVFEKSTVKA
jgi:2-oxoglutarate dehydrogenase E1 component